MDRYDPAAPVMRGVNSPLFIGGALIRDPRAVPNLCKADSESGLSAMIGILVAISSHLVAPSRYEDTFLYLLLSNSAPSVRAQDKGARILAPPPSLGCFGAGARGPGALGLAPVVATAFFHL